MAATGLTTTTVTKATGLIHICLLLHLLSNAVLAKGPPTLIDDNYQRRRLLRVGDNLRLSCPVDSSPPPLVTWTKDGESVHVGWERYRLHDNVLRARNVDQADSGVFVCRATNGFGTLDVKFLVYVYVESNDTTLPPEDFEEDIFHPPSEDAAPTFLSDEQSQQLAPGPHLSLVAGSTVRLPCRAVASPPPEVTWYKDGLALSPLQQQHPNRQDVDSQDTLLLPEVTSSDSGRYECKVHNRVGSISKVYIVTVDSSGADKSHVIVPPYPENMTAVYGSLVTFHCHVRTDTEHVPNIQWLKRVDSQRDYSRFRNSTVIAHGSEKFIVLPHHVQQQQQQQSYNDDHQPGETPVGVGGGSSAGILIRTEPRSDGIFVSRLTVDAATDGDAGLYVCVLLGRHGSRSYRAAALSVTATAADSVRDLNVDPDKSIDLVYTPIIAALVAIFVIFLLAVVGFLVHRRRSQKKQQPPGFGGSGTTGGGASTGSALLAPRSNGSGGGSTTGHPQQLQQQVDKRRCHETSSSSSPQHHLYAEMRDRTTPLGQQPPPAGHYVFGNGQPQQLPPGTPSTSATASHPGTGASRERIVRSLGGAGGGDSSFSDYSSMSRTPALAVAAPPPHLYAAAHQQLQQQQQLYQLQQQQQQPQLHYYEGC